MKKACPTIVAPSVAHTAVCTKDEYNRSDSEGSPGDETVTKRQFPRTFHR